MNEKQRAYEMILGRPLNEVRGPCALYEYTALVAPQFELVHAAGTIDAMLDWLHDWLRAEIADEMAYDEDFWRGADVNVLGIGDVDLRAFAQYAITESTITPVYVYEQCLYLEGLLDDLPGYRFVVGWEARAPRQDVAYGIVERTE